MGRRGRPKLNKEPKRKAVKVRLAPRLHAGQVTEPYRIMEAIIASDRRDLDGVKIGIAWHVGWRPDADGVQTHGKAQKRSDLDRTLDGYDAMIVLNEKSWAAFDDRAKERLLSHELEHIQVSRDKNGEPLEDDKGRVVIRMKRHDVADFASIIQRFGLPPCLTDVDIADADRPLLKLAEQKAAAEKEGSPAETRSRGEDEPVNEPIVIKCKGLRKTQVKGLIFYRPGEGYGYEYAAHLGNYEGDGASDGCCFETRAQCLHVLKDDLVCWLQELELTGTADRRRADGQRRQQMHEQIVAELDRLIAAAATSDEGQETSDDGDGTDADEN